MKSVQDKYQNLRDRVTELLLEVGDTVERHRDILNERGVLTDNIKREDINKTVKRLKENQFKIVLASSFQSGKSTLFNAICGRELNKIGSGIRTSACPVEAQYTSGDKEYAVISFKTKQEIVEGLNDLFYAKIQNPISDKEEKTLVDWFDFSDKKHQELLKKAIAKEFKVFKSNPLAYKNEIILYYAKIVSDNFDAFEKKYKLMPEIEVSIEKAKDFSYAPKDWKTRWLAGIDTTFEFSQIIYAFVKKISLHIKSPNLKRLGCVLVDSPGLNACTWDSKVAFEAYKDADAILYSFSSEKEISQSETKDLIDIKNFGYADKLFLACNLHASDIVRGKEILKSTIASLETKGFDFPHKDIQCIYQARLAWNLKQLNSRFFKSEDDKLDFEDEIKDDIKQFDRRFARDFCIDKKDDIKKAEQLSGISALLDHIETYILRDKGGKVLLNSVTKVSNPLSNISGALDYLQEQKQLAENKLLKTIEAEDEAFNNFHNSVSRELDKKMQSDIFMEKYMIAEIQKITKLDFSPENAFNSFFTGTGDRLAVSIDEIFSSQQKEFYLSEHELKKVIKKSIKHWLKAEAKNSNNRYKFCVDTAINNENSKFAQKLRAKMEDVKKEMMKNWYSYTKDTIILKAIKFDIPVDLDTKSAIYSMDLDNKILPLIFANLDNNMGLVCSFKDLCNYLGDLIGLQFFETRLDKIRNSLMENWGECVYAILQEQSSILAKNTISNIILKSREHYMAIVKEVEKEYKSRKSQALDLVRRVNEDKTKFLSEATKIKNEELKPLEKKLERILDEIKNAFNY